MQPTLMQCDFVSEKPDTYTHTKQTHKSGNLVGAYKWE